MSWFQTNGNDNEFKKALYVGGGVAGVAALAYLHHKLQILFGEKPSDSPFIDENAVSQLTDMVSTAGYIGLGVAALGLISREALRRHYERKAKEQIEYVRVIPHADQNIDEKKIMNLVHSIHQAKRPLGQRLVKGREWFQFYFVCVEDEQRGEKGRIEIYVGFPRDRYTYIQGKLAQTFPGAGLKKVHWSKVPYFNGKGSGGYLRFRNRKMKGFPLKTFEKEDKVSNILSYLRPGTSLSVSFSPTSPRRIKSVIKDTKQQFYKQIGYNPEEMKLNELDPDMQAAIKRLEDRQRSGQPVFDVKVSVWQEERETADTIYSLVNEINSAVGSMDNALYLKKTLNNPIRLSPYSVYLPGFLELLEWIPYLKIQLPMVWNAAELANLVHLPQGMSEQQRARKDKQHIYNRIDHIIPGQSDIPETEFSEGIMIGYSLNPAQDFRPIYLLDDVLRKMGLIIGKTGSGKTSIALSIAQYVAKQRLERKNGGLTIIDPKKTFAYTFLTFLNKLKLEGELTEEKESLFRFYDVTSKEYCFSINPMEKPKGRQLTEDEKNAIVEGTLEVMKNAYPGDSILFERYAGLAIRCLLEDRRQDHTILGIAEFLDKESPLRSRLYNYLKNSNDNYQQRLAKNIERMEKGFGSSEVQPVLNRLHRLAENPRTRRIFGQSETTIDPLKSMEKGEIVIYNIEGLSQDEIRLLMGYLMMKYHQAANRRKNRAENHYLLVDESHEVQLPVMWEKIIPKDREFGLCLLLMTQFLEQFNEKLLNAMKEIGGTFMSCISGEDSAKVMQKITTGRVLATDIQNYRALTASVDTEDSDGDRVTFMIKADPPYVYDQEGKPTYYGSDKQRRDDEKNEAYDHAFKEIGLKWMSRDCKLVSNVDQEIEAYLESLWKKPEEAATGTGKSVSWNLKKEPAHAEAAATKESKVVDMHARR